MPRSRVPERSAVLAGVAGAVLMLGLTGGCGFFDTRDVVQPVMPRPVPQRDPIDPDSVLWNYQTAVRYSYDGTFSLGDALDEFFRLRLSSSDSSDIGLGSLDKPQHQKAFDDNAFDAGDSLWFEFPTFEQRDKDFFNGTEARYDTLSYIFYAVRRVPGQPDSATVVTPVHTGQATIYFVVLSTGSWVIRQWLDFQDPGNPTNPTWGRYLGERVPTKPLPRW